MASERKIQAGIPYAIAAFVVDTNLDASHENTLDVMRGLSEPDKVPAYISSVIERVKDHEPGKLSQLENNIIPGDPGFIVNPNLRKIAEELIRDYAS